MYDYDRRTKTAATMDLHDKWKEIVEKHEKAEAKDFQDLLKEMSKYLRSVGYDLNLSKSYLGKEYHGSDGVRRTGVLWLTERQENNVKAEKPDQVVKWVTEALQVYGSARQQGEHTWMVDISES